MQMLKRLFGQKTQIYEPTFMPPPPAPDAAVAIPRYPPSQRGLPVATPERLLQSQWELVRKIQDTLALTTSEFANLVYPTLRNFAAYVGLLPASQDYHHADAGGLLQHSLEVSFLSARATEAFVFAVGATPERRRELEPRWRLAACFAGLLHDVGKVFDVSVSGADGREWSPGVEPMYAWATRNQLDRYFLRWTTGRGLRHEKLNTWVAQSIIGESGLRYFDVPGSVIVIAICGVLNYEEKKDQNDSEQLLLKNIVGKADSFSTNKSRERMTGGPVTSANPHNVPVQDYILDAMRQLIAKGRWRTNEAGARVWTTEEQVFVVWKPAVPDIIQVVQDMDWKGIPRDPLTLAEILVKEGVAVPYVASDTVRHNLWPVAPELVGDGNIVLDMLKLHNGRSIFGDHGLPPPAALRIGDRDASIEIPAATVESVPDETTADSDEDEQTMLSFQDGAPPEKALHVTPPDLPPARTPAPTPTATKAPMTTEARGSTLARFPNGRAGELLRQMAEDVIENRHPLGEVLVPIKDTLFIRFPEGAAHYGSPPDVLEILRLAGVIEINPATPYRAVSESDGIRGLALPTRVAKVLLDYIREREGRPADEPAPATEEKSKRESRSPARVKDVALELVRLIEERSATITSGVSEIVGASPSGGATLVIDFGYVREFAKINNVAYPPLRRYLAKDVPGVRFDKDNKHMMVDLPT